MNENNATLTKRFFGAANGYNGFKSYFDRIFDSKNFERIFIIKGGPGTGKSTFMKKISNHFKLKGFKIEEIYCSSDPNSLDGLIIYNSGKNIAFLDGTAPHECDANFPGAVDEIINLGDNFNKQKLIKHREKIINVSQKKREYYNKAYRYMKIAGAAFEFSYSTYEKCINETMADRIIIDMLCNLNRDEIYESATRLISSFGKQGYLTLDTLDQLSKKTIEINCNDIISEIFLTKLENTATRMKISHVTFPSPLSSTLTEGIYFPEENLAITKNNSNTSNSDFIYKSRYNSSKDEVESAKIIEEKAKEEAIKWFDNASKAHFELEKIYFDAMEFNKNNEILEEKIKETEYLLSFGN